MAASVSSRHPVDPVVVPIEETVDPHALEMLTDLTRADQLVRDQLAAVNRAFAICQAAEKKQAESRNQPRGSANPAALPAADEAARRAQQALANARKEFDKALAHYQKLGGALDYRRQLP
jgi:hypothetical protein